MRFLFDIEPVAKQRPRFTKTGITYKAKKTKQFEQTIGMQAKLQMSGIEPMQGPLKIVVDFFITKPKNSKYTYPKRADLDNYVKSLDGLNNICWVDDSQIVEIHACKSYSNNGHIVLNISKL